MRMVVRPLDTTPIARFTFASVERSRFDVASSSSKIAGSTSRARARQSSCRWPIEKRATPLGDLLQVATGLDDDLVRPDGSGRRLDLGVGRVGSPVGDVVADRAWEEERLLGDVAELVTVARRGRGSVRSQAVDQLTRPAVGS